MNYYKNTINPNECPITIYNVETQTAIYVFVGYAACARELFPKTSKQEQTKKIKYAMTSKKRLDCPLLGHEIAIRRSKEELIKLLDGKDFIKL